MVFEENIEGEKESFYIFPSISILSVFSVVIFLTELNDQMGGISRFGKNIAFLTLDH